MVVGSLDVMKGGALMTSLLPLAGHRGNNSSLIKFNQSNIKISNTHTECPCPFHSQAKEVIIPNACGEEFSTARIPCCLLEWPQPRGQPFFP